MTLLRQMICDFGFFFSFPFLFRPFYLDRFGCRGLFLCVSLDRFATRTTAIVMTRSVTDWILQAPIYLSIISELTLSFSAILSPLDAHTQTSIDLGSYIQFPSKNSDETEIV